MLLMLLLLPNVSGNRIHPCILICGLTALFSYRHDLRCDIREFEMRKLIY
jgi:hypothetical protein